MRRLRQQRLCAVVLGLIVIMATPATGFAHAFAHVHDDHHAHHLGSLDAHDGPAQLTPGDDPVAGHRHTRLDLARRTPAVELSFCLAPAVIARDWDCGAPEYSIAFRAPPEAVPAPAGDDPPKLRAPPLS